MATVGATLEQKWILKKVQNRANARMKSGVREYEFSENGVAIRSEIGRSENIYKRKASCLFHIKKNPSRPYGQEGFFYGDNVISVFRFWHFR